MRIGCTPRKVQLFLTFTALVAIVIVLIVLFLFNWPSFARQRMIDGLVLKNGSLELKRFESTYDMTNLRLSISVFNVTNADEVVKNSTRIQLQEIGPFVYHEYKTKEFLKNDQISGLISYKLRRRLTFRPDLSVGDPLKMQLTWINVPILAAQAYIDKLGWVKQEIARTYFDAAIKLYREQPFITDTVDNFIFRGSYRKLFNDTVIANFVPEKLLPDKKFAVLYNKNDTWVPDRDYILTTSTGFGLNQTYKDLNKYVFINGSSKLPFWGDSGQCNVLGGTDGLLFSPFLNSSENLEVFSLDVCRKLSFRHDSIRHIDGIPVYRYVLDEKTLQSGWTNKDNLCYCLSDKSIECKVDGLINLTKCIADDIFASGSHFFHGSPELSTRINGINPPNASIDEPVMYVEPNTGLPVRAYVPLQFNVKLQKRTADPLFSFFKDADSLMVPLLTVAEMAELSDEQGLLLRSLLLILDSWFVSTVLGGAIVLILVIVVVIVMLGLHCRSTGQVSRIPRETDALLAS